MFNLYFLQKVEKSVRFYKNIGKEDEDQSILTFEIRKLKTIQDDIQMESDTKGRFTWRDLTKGNNFKALLFGVILLAFNIFSGVFSMLSYTALIFGETGSTLPPNVSAIIVGSIQLLGAILATDFIDRFGRKVYFHSSSYISNFLENTHIIYPFSYSCLVSAYTIKLGKRCRANSVGCVYDA